MQANPSGMQRALCISPYLTASENLDEIKEYAINPLGSTGHHIVTGRFTSRNASGSFRSTHDMVGGNDAYSRLNTAWDIMC
jgi:hypothetical protein